MARNRSVKLVIEAVVDGAKRALGQTADAARKVGTEADKASKQTTSAFDGMTRSMRDNKQEWTTAGTALAAFGAASTAALAGSAKAAIDWESSWAGVTKTVDGSAAELEGLNEGLREMARTLPASHSEIAGVAEAAGQLGIQTDNIEGFTRTMIDLGETTNLSADQAATAIARFANIMGTSQDEFDNIGSAVVDLGNNFATTEAEIVEMGLRLAGAGRQAGLTEGEVLGLATALSSVGIEAQAGGTAFSRVIIEMSKAADTGSAELETFGRVAGMSAEAFAQAWEQDAGSAIAAFVSGLGEMEASGESIQPILEELGLTDIRVGDALRRASGAADLFTGAMQTGNDAYLENTALTKEAAQRYATTASQLEVMRNNIVDAAISLGEVFLPAISAVSGFVSDAARALGGMPEPLQKIAGFTGAAAGGLSLIAGSLMLVAPRALETWDAFRKLGIIGPGAAGAIKSIASALMGPWGLAFAGAAAAVTVFWTSQENARKRVEELTATLDTQTGAITENTREWVVNELNRTGALEASDRLGLSTGTLASAILGEESALARVNAVIDENIGYYYAAERGATDLSVAQRQAGADAAQMEAALRMHSDTLDKSTEAHARNREEVEALRWGQEENAKWAARYQAEADRLLGTQGELNTVLYDGSEVVDRYAGLTEDAAGALIEYETAIANASASFIDLNGAFAQSESAAQEWAQAQADATDTADDSWEDFVSEFAGTTDEFLAELERMAEAQTAWESNLIQLIARGAPQQFVDELAAMGPAGAAQVAMWVAMTDEEFQRGIELWSQRGGDSVAAFIDTFADPQARRVLQVAAAQLGADAVQEIGDKLASGEATLQQIISQYNLLVPIDATDDPARTVLNDLIVTLDSATGTVTVDGDPTPADITLGELIGNVNEATGTVTINGEDLPAEMTLAQLMQLILGSEESVTINGDDRTGRQVVRGFVGYVDDQTGTVRILATLGSAYAGLWEFIGTVNSQRPVLRVGMNRLAVADGGILERRANGGFDQTGRYVPRVSQMGGPAYGRTNVLWGEPETGWEAYISGKPSMRERNLRILEEAARRLGRAVLPVRTYADGGVTGPRFADMPRVAAGPSHATATLSATDRQLLAAAALQPVSVRVDSREVAYATRRGEHSFGAPGQWSNAPRIGRGAR